MLTQGSNVPKAVVHCRQRGAVLRMSDLGQEDRRAHLGIRVAEAHDDATGNVDCLRESRVGPFVVRWANLPCHVLQKVVMSPPAIMMMQPAIMGHFLPKRSAKKGTVKKLTMEPMLNALPMRPKRFLFGWPKYSCHGSMICAVLTIMPSKPVVTEATERIAQCQ